MASRSERFRDIAAKVREETNAKLSQEIATLTPLTQEEINRMLPTKSDKEQLAQLMEIVSSTTSQNQKVAALENNIKSLGSVVLKLLKATVLR